MHRGRRLRSRRRLTALAGAVAAVALVAAGYQVLPHSVALKATVPAASQPAGITVVPGSTAGVVATGTVDGTHWQLSVSRLTARGQCFTGTVGTGSLGSACDLMPRSATTPASLQVLSNDSYTAMIIGVAPDVRYVVLTTADRKELRLVPVTVGASGDRFIGLVLPHDFNVTSGAYLTDGKHVAVAPNTPPGWTRPGENSPPVGNASLGPIMADGQQWLVSAEEGPGTCVGTGYSDYPSVLSCTTVAPLTALAAVGVANVPAWLADHRLRISPARGDVAHGQADERAQPPRPCPHRREREAVGIRPGEGAGGQELDRLQRGGQVARDWRVRQL